MAAIDHEPAFEPGCFDLLTGGGNAGGIVVGLLAATQDDVTIPVALGFDDGDLAVLMDAEEVVRPLGGKDGVDGDADAAIGAVLEADGGGEAGSQFPVDLAFGGAGADGSPTDQVADVLAARWYRETRWRRARPVD